MTYKSTKAAAYMGYVTHAASVNLAPLLFAIFQRTYGVSLGYLAVFTLVTFFIQIIMDISAASFMEKVSYRVLAVVSQLLTAVGLILMGLLPLCINAEAGLMIAAVIYSSGGGLSEVMLSPLIEALPQKENGSSLSLLHSFYSWGHLAVIILTTLLLRVISEQLWFLVPLFWSLLPLWCARRFCVVPMPSMTCHEEGMGMLQLFGCKTFILLAALMFCSGAGEQIMAQWSSFYAEMGLGVSKLAGDLLGPATFALMMALGRTFYGVWSKRDKISGVLAVFATLMVICYLTAALVRSPIVSLVACGISGIGISLMWPGILSISKNRYPGGGASMFAILAFGGDVGCSVGPALCGFVSEAVGGSFALRAGILSGVLFPLMLTLGILIIRKK